MSASPPPVALEAIREELSRVLNSGVFAGSARLRRFLQFIVERSILGRAGELKEYLIGVEVFDRGDPFDPRGDSVVRVEARSLRAKLERYYATEGRNSAIVIELPKGRYVPRFRFREAVEERVADRRGKFDRKRAAVYAAAVLVLASLGTLTAWRGVRDASGPSVAVIPFRNLGSDPGSNYFAQGLMEELTTHLCRIEGLRVIARASTAGLESRTLDLARLRANLGVRWVLEGGVRREGTRLRVSVQLVHATDGNTVWSEVYERDSRQVFRIQEEIASAIATNLKLRVISPSSARDLPPETVEAYDLYLRGRFFRKQMTPAGIEKSTRLFEQAVQRDAGYAPAWAALADSYAMMGFHGLAELEPSISKARQAAGNALSLDPANSRARGALGWIAFVHDRDSRTAANWLHQAIELDPSWPNARQWLAFTLASQARFDEAIQQSSAACRLDPLSFLTSADLATILYYARRYPDALKDARRAIELDSAAGPGHLVQGAVLVALRRPEEAIPEFQRALDSAHGSTAVLARLGHAYALAGKPDRAAACLSQIGAEQGHRMDLAMIHVGLGHHDEARRLLEAAIANKEGGTLFLNIEPLFDPIQTKQRE